MVETYVWKIDHNTNITFHTPKEAQDFVAKQRDYYQWINSGGMPQIRPLISGLQSRITAQLASVSDALQRWVSTPQPANFPGHVFEQAFQNGRIPIVGSLPAKFLDDLKNTDGQDAVAGALSILVGTDIRLDQGNLNSRIFRGISAASNFLDGINRNGYESRTALDNIAYEFSDKLRSTDAVIKNQIELLRQEEISSKRRGWRRALHWRRGISKSLATQRAEFEKAITNFDNVRRAYEEFMKIKSPVEYWSAKAGGHRDKANGYKKVLFWYAGIAGALVLSVLCFVITRIVDIADAAKPTAVYVAWAALGVVVSTMAFWAARIIVRLVMSEHHLSIDAEERATMVMTYLSLTNTGAASDEDRKIVLGSLFRPTADGIVKDDAAPDFSPASILSKGLATR